MKPRFEAVEELISLEPSQRDGAHQFAALVFAHPEVDVGELHFYYRNVPERQGCSARLARLASSAVRCNRRGPSRRTEAAEHPARILGSELARLVEPRDLLGGEREARGADVVVQLLDGLCAD